MANDYSRFDKTDGFGNPGSSHFIQRSDSRKVHFPHFLINKSRTGGNTRGSWEVLIAVKRRALALRGVSRQFWRGWAIPCLLVQRCFLCRVSWSLSPCFCPEEGFILRWEERIPRGEKPTLRNIDVKSVKLSHQSAHVQPGTRAAWW